MHEEIGKNMQNFVKIKEYHEKIERNMMSARRNRDKNIFCTKDWRESEELIYDFIKTGNRRNGSSDSD